MGQFLKITYSYRTENTELEHLTYQLTQPNQIFFTNLIDFMSIQKVYLSMNVLYNVCCRQTFV